MSDRRSGKPLPRRFYARDVRIRRRLAVALEVGREIRRQTPALGRDGPVDVQAALEAARVRLIEPAAAGSGGRSVTIRAPVAIRTPRACCER